MGGSKLCPEAGLLSAYWRARQGRKAPETQQSRNAFFVLRRPARGQNSCCRLLGPHWASSAYHLGDVGFLHALQAACRYKEANWTTTCPEQVTGQLSDQLRKIVFFQPPDCPVSGRDLEQKLGLTGPAVGACLGQIRRLWAETEFTATKNQLLAHAGLEDFYNQYKNSDTGR